MAVTQVFREFGPVFVKIRRDAKQMPFAFCQYTVSISTYLSIFTDSIFRPLRTLIAPSERVVVV
jgi:hypothetical protein